MQAHEHASATVISLHRLETGIFLSGMARFAALYCRKKTSRPRMLVC
jgi:hypothetical protein